MSDNREVKNKFEAACILFDVAESSGKEVSFTYNDGSGNEVDIPWSYIKKMVTSTAESIINKYPEFKLFKEGFDGLEE